ncbi:MAG: M23 family metallopeptidase [Clostridia bacterium]|nr:M23 family metallopeptidase [Clostridia bacterium]
MNEQNNKEEKKKEKGKVKRFSKLNKEKKKYLVMASSCLAALVIIVVLAVVISVGGAKPNNQLKNSSIGKLPNSSVVDSSNGNDSSGGDEPVVNTPEGMTMPVEAVVVGSEYGFYYNKTLNVYHEHTGLDFTAAAGTDVLAVEDGRIESIYKDDLLLGTEIVINHGGGLKSMYRFVNEVDGLKVGDVVEKGEVIATVAEATGEEYKEGAHLHFEILKNGENVDPTTYLTLEEK